MEGGYVRERAAVLYVCVLNCAKAFSFVSLRALQTIPGIFSPRNAAMHDSVALHFGFVIARPAFPRLPFRRELHGFRTQISTADVRRNRRPGSHRHDAQK